MVGVAAARRGRSAPNGSGGERELDGDALVYGEHAFERHGFGEHGAVVGSPRTVAGHSAGGIRKRAAGRGEKEEWSAEGAVSCSARHDVAAGNHCAKEENVHVAVGTVVARSTAIANGRKLRAHCTADCAHAQAGRSSRGVAGGFSRADFMVAAVGDFFPELMGTPWWRGASGLSLSTIGLH